MDVHWSTSASTGTNDPVLFVLLTLSLPTFLCQSYPFLIIPILILSTIAVFQCVPVPLTLALGTALALALSSST
jgi:hypothetical protein